MHDLVGDKRCRAPQRAASRDQGRRHRPRDRAARAGRRGPLGPAHRCRGHPAARAGRSQRPVGPLPGDRLDRRRLPGRGDPRHQRWLTARDPEPGHDPVRRQGSTRSSPAWAGADCRAMGAMAERLPSSTLGLRWLGALIIFAAGAFTTFLMVIAGTIGIGLAILVFVVLGNPSAGGAYAPPPLPAFWRVIGPWLPTGAGTSAVRAVAYFDGVNSTSQALVMAGYGVACPGRGRALAIGGFCASWPGPVREPAGELRARDFPIVELPGMIGKARALCRQCRPYPMLGRSPTAGATGKAAVTVEPPSSSGLGHRPFKAAARVRIPLGVQLAAGSCQYGM